MAKTNEEKVKKVKIPLSVLTPAFGDARANKVGTKVSRGDTVYVDLHQSIQTFMTKSFGIIFQAQGYPCFVAMR